MNFLYILGILILVDVIIDIAVILTGNQQKYLNFCRGLLIKINNKIFKEDQK
jgi:hypothetical protein